MRRCAPPQEIPWSARAFLHPPHPSRSPATSVTCMRRARGMLGMRRTIDCMARLACVACSAPARVSPKRFVRRSTHYEGRQGDPGGLRCIWGTAQGCAASSARRTRGWDVAGPRSPRGSCAHSTTGSGIGSTVLTTGRGEGTSANSIRLVCEFNTLSFDIFRQELELHELTLGTWFVFW